MNKQIEALKMAIEAIEFQAFGKYKQEVVAKLKEALAEAEKQEPVAWMNDKTPSGIFATHKEGANNFGCDIPLYTHPAPMQMNQTLECPSYLHGMKSYHPAPSWQSLSDDEIQNELKNMWDKGLIPSYSIVEFARAIEQALKEKNHG